MRKIAASVALGLRPGARLGRQPGGAGPARRDGLHRGNRRDHPSRSSAEYVSETIRRADAAGAALVVFTLRTPGGLVDSTRDINNAIIRAKTPVAVFVGPSGTAPRRPAS